VNGVLEDTAGKDAQVRTTNPLRFGGSTLWGNYLGGQIDDVAVFDAALDITAIQDIYNAGVPKDESARANLTNYWRMGDGDTYPTLTDSIGGLNATMTNQAASDIETRGADFILGQPPVVTFTGQDITVAKFDIDPVVAATFTDEDYFSFTTGTPASFLLADAPGEQANGDWVFTVVGDISGYTSGTDRGTPSKSLDIEQQATLTAMKTVVNGVDDRILAWYIDTDDSPFWTANGFGATLDLAYQIQGMMPDCRCTFTVIHSWWQCGGDLSKVDDIVMDNFRIVGSNGRSFYLSTSTDPNGKIYWRRVRFEGGNPCVLVGGQAHQKVQFESCSFGVAFGWSVQNSKAATFLQCDFFRAVNSFGNYANIFTNCKFIESVNNYLTNAVITNCKSDDGSVGDTLSVAAMLLWYGQAVDGYPPIVDPVTGSPLIDAGADCDVTHDIHGRAISNGSRPIGASDLVNMVAASTDPGIANVLLGVTYYINGILKTGTSNSTDPGIANVLKDVTYYINSVLKTGTSESTDPGIGNVIKDITYYINSVLKTGTFDEAARNVDPGIANVKIDETYKILNVDLTGTYSASPSPPTIPTISAASVAAGTGFTVTFSGADADTTNTLKYKAATASSWTTESTTKSGESGSWTITATDGLYLIQMTSADDAGNSVDVSTYVQVKNSTTRKVQFRVKNVVHVPGKSKKKLILEKIDKPIGYAAE